jgi:hypothetical protein
MLVLSMPSRPAPRGQGAAVLSPLVTSRARGRVSAMFSSRRASRRLFRQPAAPVRTPPPSYRFFEGPCFFVDGLPNYSSCMPSTIDLPQTSRQLSIGEFRGPRTSLATALRWPFCQRLHALGRRRGSPRLADPVASTLSSFAHHREHRDPCAWQLAFKGSGCTPHRPPTGPSRG